MEQMLSTSSFLVVNERSTDVQVTWPCPTAVDQTEADVTSATASWPCYQQRHGFNVTSGVDGLNVTPSTIVVLVLLSAIIVGTFVGNCCVILSVVTFDKMRTLSNGLIASLASADVLVAVVVLPISLQYELAGRWTLGPRVCDLWITSDVFCCTASILNIVVIAVDRYWLITRNVDYTHSATMPRRTVCSLMIASAWLLAALIAGSPLLGWRTGSERDDPTVCLISQDYAYTVFSTFGAFWFPLAVILIVYARIFAFARRRTSRQGPVNNEPGRPGSAATTARRRTTSGCGSANGGRKLSTHGRAGGGGASSSMSTGTSMQRAADRRKSGSPSSFVDFEERNAAGDRQQTSNVNGNLGICTTGWNTLTLPPIPYVNDPSFGSSLTPPPDSTMAGGRAGISGGGSSSNIPDNELDGEIDAIDVGVEVSVYIVATSAAAAVADLTGCAGGTGDLRRRRDTATGCIAAQAAAVADRRRKRRRAMLVRRSARTLGMIIGGFLVCWMPFFIVATAAPFCSIHRARLSSGSQSVSEPESVESITWWCRIPPSVSSVVLWLGYSNSLLNPAIYAIWDRSFRRSFHRLIASLLCCCRCGGGTTAGKSRCCEGLPASETSFFRKCYCRCCCCR